MLEILNYFPKNISEILYQNIHDKFHDLEEIRIRVDKPIILRFSNSEEILSYKVSRRRNIKNHANDM